MGRYLSTNFVSYLGEKRLKVYSKTSYLRKAHHKGARTKQRTLSCGLSSHCGDVGLNAAHNSLCRSQAVRFYSTSSRNAFKTEPPIGIFQEEKQPSLQLSMLGMRLGESFQRLSKHINVYFSQKELTVAQHVGKSALVYTHHEPQRRQQRRIHSHRPFRDRRSLEESIAQLKAVVVVDTTAQQEKEQTATSRLYAGLQLFHISSLATRFGESYNCVANHINSMFSTSPAQESQGEADVDRSLTTRHGRRRKTLQASNISHPPVHEEVTHGVKKEEAKADEYPSFREEGYLHFASHINRYFGAKVTDSAGSSTSANRSNTVSQQSFQSLPPNSPGLFHTSNTATSFGANHAHMANHINHYFHGQQGFEDDLDGDYMDDSLMLLASAQEEKPPSFMQYLLNNTAALPDLIGSYLGVGAKSQEAQVPQQSQTLRETPTQPRVQRPVFSQGQADEMTRDLLENLRSANTPSSILTCTEELNRHLITHPTCKALVWQEKGASQLLRYRRAHAEDVKLQRAIRESMALIGYLDPVKGRGIRMLSIDGGGTRGVVPLEVLKLIEAHTGRRIHELFDYICGVSTGAVLAFMIGLGRFSLDDCEEMYRRFGSGVFRQNPLVGTMKMGLTHSYYSSQTWESLLKEKMGERVLIKTSRSEFCPKVSAVSAVVNWGMSPKAFLFRNYNHAPGRLSRYPGGSAYKLWEAVRASSAAPGYFREFPLHSDIHQDGGLIQNNPCALAVHECRLLWPRHSFQCVLSLGTGRYDNAQRGPATSTSLRAKLNHLIYSATDTEGVHTLLGDLLEDDVYFRFNPMLSAGVSLDECRPEALDQLKADTLHYLHQNKLKMELLCTVLRAKRSALSRGKDWVDERVWELRQRLDL